MTDPIKLSDFRPVACDQLGRVGNRNDGGYVVPLQAVTAAGALLSFGLSHDWTFERDFKHRNPGAIVHCYDHTVSLRTAFIYSLGQLAAFMVRVKARYLRRALTWIDYLLFFRTDKVHFRQRVWRDRRQGRRRSVAFARCRRRGRKGVRARRHWHFLDFFESLQIGQLFLQY